MTMASRRIIRTFRNQLSAISFQPLAIGNWRLALLLFACAGARRQRKTLAVDRTTDKSINRPIRLDGLAGVPSLLRGGLACLRKFFDVCFVDYGCAGVDEGRN